MTLLSFPSLPPPYNSTSSESRPHHAQSAEYRPEAERREQEISLNLVSSNARIFPLGSKPRLVPDIEPLRTCHKVLSPNQKKRRVRKYRVSRTDFVLPRLLCSCRTQRFLPGLSMQHRFQLYALFVIFVFPHRFHSFHFIPFHHYFSFISPIANHLPRISSTCIHMPHTPTRAFLSRPAKQSRPNASRTSSQFS